MMLRVVPRDVATVGIDVANPADASIGSAQIHATHRSGPQPGTRVPPVWQGEWAQPKGSDRRHHLRRGWRDWVALGGQDVEGDALAGEDDLAGGACDGAGGGDADDDVVVGADGDADLGWLVGDGDLPHPHELARRILSRAMNTARWPGWRTWARNRWPPSSISPWNVPDRTMLPSSSTATPVAASSPGPPNRSGWNTGVPARLVLVTKMSVPPWLVSSPPGTRKRPANAPTSTWFPSRSTATAV